MFGLFKRRPKDSQEEPWLKLYGAQSRWADGISDNHGTRDFAIQLGLLAAGFGAGYKILKVKQVSKSTMVYDPHTFEIVVSYCCAKRYVKPKTESWKDFYLTAHCKSYSIRSIALGVRAACKDVREKRREVKIDEPI